MSPNTLRVTCSLNQWVRSLVGAYSLNWRIFCTCRNCGGGDKTFIDKYEGLKFRGPRSLRQTEQASPQNILECLGLDKDNIHGSALLVSDFIKANGFTDLICISFDQTED
ncbi:hypothetical protein TNCV_4854181 [Trichonephila clavipes]|nr:hypothetical protein TNCV_4854181 [Trichonephila clavipes]